MSVIDSVFRNEAKKLAAAKTESDLDYWVLDVAIEPCAEWLYYTVSWGGWPESGKPPESVEVHVGEVISSLMASAPVSPDDPVGGA